MDLVATLFEKSHQSISDIFYSPVTKVLASLFSEFSSHKGGYLYLSLHSNYQNYLAEGHPIRQPVLEGDGYWGRSPEADGQEMS